MTINQLTFVELLSEFRTKNPCVLKAFTEHDWRITVEFTGYILLLFMKLRVLERHRVYRSQLHILCASYLQYTNCSHNRLLKKLVVAQLLKRFASCYGTYNFTDLCCEPSEITTFPVVFLT
jgi:hypothetical protein